MFTSLKLTNFKAWRQTGNIKLKPVTMLLGANSSGKSSLIQSLLLLKQTAQSPDRSIQLNLGGDEVNDLFNFGSFENVLKKGATPRRFSIEFAFAAGSSLRVNQGQFFCRYGQTPSGGIAIQQWQLHTGEHRFRAIRREKGAFSITLNDEPQPRGKGTQFTPERSIALPAEAIALLDEHGAVAEDLSLAIRRQLENMVYLGPLRRKPERDYVWNKSTPGQIESDGHRAIDILLASALAKDDKNSELLAGVSSWLARMKVADKLAVKESELNKIRN